MKKRYRIIKVNGVEYAWSVRNDLDGDGNDYIKIWRRENGKKKELIVDSQFYYTDEECDNNDMTITPAKVANIIRAVTEPNPLSTEKTFTNWLADTFGCVNCDNFDKNTHLPLNERKCTHTVALAPNGAYKGSDGVEEIKAFLRQDDINRKAEGMKTNPEFWSKQPDKDINEYYVCDHFENKGYEEIT
jgi:hypothetical protein